MSSGLSQAGRYFMGDGGLPSRPIASTIVWYDQATPIYCCADHAEVVQPLRFEGGGRARDPSEVRAAATRRLVEEDVECDVCAGQLARKVMG